jgi:methanogenic corrinoid protein MtbC1
MSGAADAAGAPDVETVRHWLSLTKTLDADRLVREFQRRLAERSVLDFLDGCLGPYLTQLGQHWSSGAARISHEHFATECVTEFLQARWRPLSEARSGADAGSIVLATPPGERHVLGLHMAAWVVALAELRVVFLGADTPMEEIAFAVRQHRARGVVLSVSAAYRGDLHRELKELTAGLTPEVPVVVGGAGARLRWKGARVLNGLSDLQDWARQRHLEYILQQTQ